MYIKKILVLLTLFVIGAGVSYAQETPRVVAGEWELVKVETKLLSQKDDHLLEQKTLTKPEEFKHITGLIPVKIAVEGETCSITTARGFIETGKYNLEDPGVLLYQKAMPLTPQMSQHTMSGVSSPEALWLPYRYRIETGGVLVLELPRTFFMDTDRHLPVAQECTCYYKKKQ